jgi:uncharacterized membrane protein YphA (DoxX/SURF4 family)
LGSGGASYDWWAGFLNNFVIPNASWIAKFIAISECLIGVALILGLFTGAMAIAGLSLNVIYMFTGSAGVNPMYAVLSVRWDEVRNMGRFLDQGRWHGRRGSSAGPSAKPGEVLRHC